MSALLNFALLALLEAAPLRTREIRNRLENNGLEVPGKLISLALQRLHHRGLLYHASDPGWKHPLWVLSASGRVTLEQQYRFLISILQGPVARTQG
jgi:hypothetical protein